MQASEDIAAIVDATELGSLPGAYAQLARVLRDTSASREQIARAVGMDPGLVARLLKLVNAPGFARRQIETVSHACLYLGRDQLRELALATSVVHMFRGLPEHLLDMRSFWTHSVAVGLLAESLAKQLRFYGDESLFVSGLLHDLGTLALSIGQPRSMRSVLMDAENTGQQLTECELRVLGFDHTEVAEQLLKQWRLPEMHTMVARYHHGLDDDIARSSLAQPISLCHVADVIATGMQWGSSGERRAIDIDPRAWTASGLTLKELDIAVDGIEEQLEAVVSALV